MRDELSTRQAAIRLRLAGENIEDICRTLNRSAPWFLQVVASISGCRASRSVRSDASQTASDEPDAAPH